MEGIMTYAQSFFGWLLQTTLIASVVTCLILLIQKMLGGKLGPRWCHALWLVLLIRMVLPWAPSSRVSLLNLIPSWDRQIQREQSSESAEQQGPSQVGQISGTAEAITAQKSESDVTIQKRVIPEPGAIADIQIESQPWLVSIRPVLPVLWLAGAIVIGAYLLMSNFALWRIVKQDSPLVNQSMLELFEECKTQMGVQSLVVVVPSNQIRSPALFGFIRPRLLLPLEMLDNATQEEMRYVFLHELAHLRRHDIYFGWLTSLLQVLHWFNPLIWFAFYRMRSDRELACDALVLACTQKEESQKYGQAIVSLVRRFSRSRPLPAMAGIIENKSQLKRRIAMITQFRNNSYRWSPLAVILVIILACISLPNAKLTRASETLASKPAHQSTFRKIQIPHDASRLRSDAQLSPDGKRIAFVTNFKLWVMPRAGALGPDFPGTPTLLNTGNIEVAWEGLTWSRDGRWIAFNDREWIEKDGPNRKLTYIISVDGGKPKEVYENWADDYVYNYRMSLSPNGKTLAFSSIDANELHIYTIPVDGGVPKRLVEAPAREPVFSPDGKRIAYVEGKNRGTEGGGLWVVSAHGGAPRLVVDAGHATSPVWSPDGRMIAFLDLTMRRQISIIPISENGGPAGQKIIIDCPEGIDWVERLTGWTPDNKIGTIFFEHREYGLYTLPTTGGIVTLVAHGEERLNHPRWSPDGKRIICTNNVREGRDGWLHYGLASISAEGGEISTIPVRADAQIAKLSRGSGNHVSPDGQTLVFAGRRKQEAQWLNHIWTLPIKGGEPKQLTDAPAPLTDHYPCWSPEGKSIAFIRYKNDPTTFAGADRGIFIIPADGGEPRRLTRESDNVNFGIAWSPDGKWLAYFSSDKKSPVLKVVPAQGGPSRVVLKLEKWGLDVRKELAWSPDSKRIAFNGSKVVRIMSLDDGSIVEIDPHLADTHMYHLDWSRDGDRLVFAGHQGGDLGFWMMENFLPEDMGK